MTDVILILEQCKERLEGLDANVDNIRKLNTSQVTSPAAPPPSRAESYSGEEIPSSMAGSRAVARCHECHGPVGIGTYHEKYPHGIDKCPLQHYDLCNGNIPEGKDKGGHIWRGCPEEYVGPDDNYQEDVLDEEQSEVSYTSLKSLDKSYVPSRDVSPATTGRRQTRSMGDRDATDSPKTGKDQNLVESERKSSGAPVSDTVFSLPCQGKHNEDLLLESELAELSLMEARLEKIKLVKEKKKKAQEELDRISCPAQENGGARRKTIMETVNRIRVENRSVEPSRRERSSYRGPIMDEIRRDNGTRETVDTLMDDVHDISALSRAGVSSRSGQPHLRTPAPQGNRRVAGVYTNTEYPEGAVLRHRSPVSKPKPKETLYRWETNYDRYGGEYRSLVEVTPVKHSPKRQRSFIQMEDGWIYDERLGRAYRKNGRQEQTSTSQAGYSRRSVLGQDRYRHSSTPPRLGRPVLKSPVKDHRAHSGSDRYPSMVPLDSHQQSEREGKTLTIADHARLLPLECARSVNSKNINFTMFMYGAIKEIHSARIGVSQPFESGVLEAKLQHLLNVINVTCLNSTASEFKPVSWSVGRTYDGLVQAKIDSGRETWLDFDQLHRGSPHAAEMVAAEREHRAALTSLVKPKVDVRKTERNGGGVKGDKKPLCPTWNSSEVEGKCKWETEHLDVKCNRSHYCTFCEKKFGNTRTNHQEKFCKRKPEDDR